MVYLCLLVIFFAVLNHSFDGTLDELSFSTGLELYFTSGMFKLIPCVISV